MGSRTRASFHAAEELLLGAPEQTIAAIAQACGFTGEHNFYRVFRAETWLAPGEYRAPAG
ncbi:helix-turn-helix domain-containing protein [Nocardia tengchongensis]|uniref:helix-turn-helix domain-containing protein n=1 Tax=Nocardia tengchongensis TaxID=2055889 RepID=UPI0036C820C6